MTEALASKTCTPCRGGTPPLTREQAELFHAQAPDWQLAEEAHRIERSFRFRNFREALTLFRRLVNSQRPKAIIRISASVGAMRRSLCRPRRSRDCMRTTSSWPPRLTAYSLGRPRRERVLVVLQLAPHFRCRARSSTCSRLMPRCDSRWSPAAIGVKATYTSAFGTQRPCRQSPHMSASLIGRLGQALSGYPPAPVRCRSRARASLRTRHQGPSTMGFEDERT